MYKKIILASQSPRRRELMTMINLPFSVESTLTEEIIDPNLALPDAICNVAKAKAIEIFENNQDKIIVGADTIVSINNKVLGKPKDDETAIEMLKELSGKTHEVITGVCILCGDKEYKFAEIAKVTFYDLTEEEIVEYVNTKEPLDKAGAYAIQGLGSLLIKKIDGDYYTIVGLPIAKVARIIKSLSDQ